jgi:2-polyprenyl-3-methyl-5-hydroxy-6-metoxy-1,4-benzoquinol methylase
MQRLSEEFQHGRRVQELLRSIVQALSAGGVRPPFRIVDIGCGTGYVVRWLAAHGGVDQAELVGVDFNSALITEAQRLAAAEQLNCRFEVANAFRMSPPATVYLSTGVIHHFRGDQALREFFSQHDHPATMCFAHMDFQPTVLARPGAWLFHYVRMREPLAHHDGVVSARRAHTASTILRAARGHSFLCGTYGARIGKLPIPRVFHTIIGIRPGLVAGLQRALGRRASRLGEMA